MRPKNEIDILLTNIAEKIRRKEQVTNEDLEQISDHIIFFVPNTQRQRLIHIAAQNNHIQAARKLISYGANLSVLDIHSLTAICYTDNIELYRLLNYLLLMI